MRYDYKFPNHWIVIQEKIQKIPKKKKIMDLLVKEKSRCWDLDPLFKRMDLGSGSIFMQDGSRIQIGIRITIK